jgi:hypothetical protein
MMGKPKSLLGRIFGPSGKYVKFIWKYVAPVEAVIVFYVVLAEQLESVPSYGKIKLIFIYNRF